MKEREKKRNVYTRKDQKKVLTENDLYFYYIFVNVFINILYYLFIMNK